MSHHRMNRPVLAAIAVCALALAVGLGAVSGCKDKSNPVSPQAGGGGRATTVHIIVNAATQGSMAFSPSPDTVSLGAGGQVSWHNDDNINHTSTSDGGSALTWNLNPVGPGKTSTAVTFSAAGTYAYHCAIHPSMTGIIVVVP